MTITEFAIDLDANDDYDEPAGIGTLYVTDATLLVRPRRDPVQYHDIEHDANHAYQVLELGNCMDTCEWNIIYAGGVEAAHQLLDRVFHAYVDGCCRHLWCDACVYYFVGDKAVRLEEYGFEDGHYTMVFNVYCGVAGEQTEDLLDWLTTDETDRFVVVRPDGSELGYNARGFAVEQSPPDPVVLRRTLFGR